MKDNPGYSTGRTAARDPAVIGNGNDPLRDQLNASPPRPCTEEHHKNLGDGSVQTVQGYGKSKPRVSSSQADKQQAEGNGWVGPKGTGDQASGDSRINKR